MGTIGISRCSCKKRKLRIRIGKRREDSVMDEWVHASNTSTQTLTLIFQIHGFSFLLAPPCYGQMPNSILFN